MSGPKKARQGDGEYMSRYFFYNNREIPDEYEKTVPQVFPTLLRGTLPGFRISVTMS